MKFPALALCLAGTLVAGAAARADHDHHKMSGKSSDKYHSMDPNARDPYTGVSIYAGERLYHRDVLFPELQDERTVAQQVSEIVSMQQQEIAELNALAPRAQTAGFTNISTVYEHMASHHTELANFGSNWLSTRGYTVPTAPSNVTVADNAPEITVQQQIAEHQQMLDHALMMRKTSPSSTVRGMLLWGATATTQHLSLLRTLERDVDLGRKELSAALRIQLAEPGTVTASNTDLVEQYVAEERTLFATEETTAVAETEPAPAVEQPVVEQPIPDAPVAEAPAPAPAPAPAVTQPQQPVDTTVRPQLNTNRNTTSRVMGRRQTTRSMRVRARRAAH
jgi:hypothetical protein